jgi:hypothetical protein
VPDEDLITLARLRFTAFGCDDEGRVFEKLIQKTGRGEKANFVPDTKSEILTNPVNAGSWGKDRIIRAEWIVWLCTDPKASGLVTSHGIEIIGARVDGVLDLAWAKIQFPLRATECAFTDDLILNQSSLRCLELQTTEIEGLQGDGLSVERDLVFGNGFRAKGPVLLRNATIGGSLQCNEGHFDRGPSGQHNGKFPPALDLENAKIGAGANLQSVEARGVVVLSNATIAGNLDCEGAHLDGVAGNQDQPDNALFAKSMKVTGNAHFCQYYYGKEKRFTATGAVVLSNATIEGNLDCVGGQFSARDTAINAESVKVGADVYMWNGFQSNGTVNFRSATVGGNLDCRGGCFYNPGSDALIINSAKIEGSVLLRGHFKARGTLFFLKANIGSVLELGTDDLNERAILENAILDVRDAKAGGLLNGTQSWPRECKLHGFVFNVLDDRATSNAETQIKWLGLQQSGDHFIAQPYEQMAAVLRNMGLQEDAVKVLIAKNDECGRHIHGFNDFFWYHVFGPIIGYGYRPMRALLISAAVIVVGWVVFWAGFTCKVITPTQHKAYVVQKSGEPQLSEFYPKFNAFVYSLETFVPLVKLGVGESWMPNANRQGSLRLGKVAVPITGSLLRAYLWFHIIAGWVLTTLWVGGLTGLVKS